MVMSLLTRMVTVAAMAGDSADDGEGRVDGDCDVAGNMVKDVLMAMLMEKIAIVAMAGADDSDGETGGEASLQSVLQEIVRCLHCSTVYTLC